ncbi:MAG: hypothetical protein AAFU67_06590 [Bacteroidota bacterium]
MNPLRYFLVPLAAMAGLALLATQQLGEEWAWTIIPPVLAIAAVLGLGPQIKLWYWKRWPPDLATEYAPLLDRFAFYLGLDLAGKREFRRRAFLLRETINFRGQGIESIPEDVQVMVAASAACVSYGRKDFKFGDVETIVFYPHIFPSPAHQVLHASELFIPDGVIIYTLPFLARSVIEPQSYLQLGIYEFARAYQLLYPGAAIPELRWEQIQQISSFKEEKIKEFIGLPVIDQAAIGVVLYFTHATSFQRLAAREFKMIGQALKLG